MRHIMRLIIVFFLINVFLIQIDTQDVGFAGPARFDGVLEPRVTEPTALMHKESLVIAQFGGKPFGKRNRSGKRGKNGRRQKGGGGGFRKGKKGGKNRFLKRKKLKAEMVALNKRATSLLKQGRYARAEKLFSKLLALKRERLGAGHWKTAGTMIRLSAINMKLGRFKNALSYINNGQVILKRTLGIGNQKTVQTYHVLAATYNHLGRSLEAEKASRTALKLNLKHRGNWHQMTGRSYYFLGFSQMKLRKEILAEKNLRQSVEVFEKTVGVNHAETAKSITRFADLYRQINRPGDALPLYQRALATRQKVLGKTHPNTGRTHFGLARVYLGLKQFENAEKHFKQAIKIHNRSLGKSHQYNLLSVDGLARTYRDQGRYEEAVQLTEQTLAQRKRTLGSSHYHTANGQVQLARLYWLQAHYGKAEKNYQQALAILKKNWGPEHFDVMRAQLGLGVSYLAQQRTEQAFAMLETVSHSVRQSDVSGSSDLKESAKSQTISRNAQEAFITAAWKLLQTDPDRQAELLAKSFEAAQWAGRSSTSAAIAKMSARFGAGSGPLAELTRQGQDLGVRWQALNKELLRALGENRKQRNDSLIKSLRRELSNITRNLKKIDQRLDKEFPKYATLAKGRALKISEVQAQLGDKEGLLLFLNTRKRTYVWMVTKKQVKWQAIRLTRKALRERVSSLRKGLDVYAQKERSFIPEKAEPDVAEDIPPYELEAAHGLYRQLFGGFEQLLEKQNHLVIVADGPLTAIPFHALVKTRPSPELPAQKRYKMADWLVRHHATTVLPSVSSLKALRARALDAAQATKTMIAFGDPVFSRSATAQSKAINRSYARYFKGPRANLNALNGLQRLPGTRAELVSIANTLQVGKEDLKLGEEATEQTVKASKLDDYQIVYFATHGLVAGDIEGLGEPALALTVPQKATANDDGLLTASEVATLKLNADWLIMSACNTAAGDKPGAQALSGLARAFFYAGAKTLLVSHWPVDDGAAVSLTTKAFEIISETEKAGKTVGRAQALRGSMLAMINSGGPHSHPTFWAPFIVVGEGAAHSSQ